jgi:DNA-binding LytR/AlgR family response regulator
MNLCTLIVDDEPHAIALIERYARSVPGLVVAGTCRNGFEAFGLLQQQSIDLIFLDVKMPGIKGTDLVKSLKKPPMVIFTTAYDEYAVDGFNLDAVDYLVKPFSFERFLKSVGKAMAYHPPVMALQPLVPQADNLSTMSEHFLHLRIERRTIKVNTEDILWIESLKDYIRVILPDKTLVTKQKISVTEKLLPASQFLRIHRSFIVPFDKIQAYHPNHVLIAGKEIPIGRNYKDECCKRLG